MRGFGDHRTFRALRERGVRGSSGPLTVVHVEPGDGDHEAVGASGALRVAFAIGRSVGPAVVRNKARRRLRHLLLDRQRSPSPAPPGSYLVIVRPGVHELDHAALGRHLHRALDRIEKKNQP